MNLPNKLSLLRICMIPFFVALYFLPFWWAPIAAVVVFLLAAATDFLDGYIARKYNLVTDLGKLLDPIADKVLVTAALFVAVATNPFQYSAFTPSFPLSDTQNANFYMIFLAVVGILILARELLISAMRQIAASKGVVVQANIFGKVKTICQDVTLPIVLLLYTQRNLDAVSLEKFGGLFDVLRIIATVMLVLTLVITVLSGVIYLVQNRHVFVETKPVETPTNDVADDTNVEVTE